MPIKLAKLLTTSLCLTAFGWVGGLAVATNASAQERYVVIGGSSVDPYWNVVRRGAVEAGKDLNVSVDYFPKTRIMLPARYASCRRSWHKGLTDWPPPFPTMTHCAIPLPTSSPAERMWLFWSKLGQMPLGWAHWLT